MTTNGTPRAAEPDAPDEPHASDAPGVPDGSAGGPLTAEVSYEQARGELIEVVQRLEAGGSTLEESLALWERGEELARVCRARLEGARERLEAALADEGAAEEPETEPGAESDER